MTAVGKPPIPAPPFSKAESCEPPAEGVSFLCQWPAARRAVIFCCQWDPRTKVLRGNPVFCLFLTGNDLPRLSPALQRPQKYDAPSTGPTKAKPGRVVATPSRGRPLSGRKWPEKDMTCSLSPHRLMLRVMSERVVYEVQYIGQGPRVVCVR